MFYVKIILFVVLGSLLTAEYFLCLQLEDNLLQNITSLVKDSEDPFWRKGRFLINAGRQLASYQDGECSYDHNSNNHTSCWF